MTHSLSAVVYLLADSQAPLAGSPVTREPASREALGGCGKEAAMVLNFRRATLSDDLPCFQTLPIRSRLQLHPWCEATLTEDLSCRIPALVGLYFVLSRLLFPIASFASRRFTFSV